MGCWAWWGARSCPIGESCHNGEHVTGERRRGSRARESGQEGSPMTTISRRTLLRSAALATACASAPRVAQGQPSIKIGTAVLGDYSMAGPVIVALEKGFFRQENVN